MQIDFYSSESKPEYGTSVEEYTSIWIDDGKKITEAVEKVSGLKFLTNHLKAEVYEGVSQSKPLKLRASYNSEYKKAVLVHELCHILLRDNNLKARAWGGNLSLGIHSVIDLVLFDIWTEIWGEKFAREAVDEESNRSETYKKAWEWALGFSKDERKNRFDRFKTNALKDS